MSIEVIQPNEVYEEVIVRDSWPQPIDDILHGDFTGFSTFLVVILLMIFIRPILSLLVYAGAAFLIFAVVKQYV
jgi:hypothetical protein